MKSNKDFPDIFDQDFEVTYEEDPEMNLEGSRQEDKIQFEDIDDDYRTDETSVFPGYDDDMPDEDLYEDDYGSSYDKRHKKGSESSYNNSYDDGDDRAAGSRRRRRGGVPLAAPIKKGGKLLSRLTSALIRQLSLILILVTTVYVTYNFWRASTPYGDIMESVRTRNITMTLTAYLCCVAVFILFEMISLLWAMTRTRVHDGTRTWKEDTGRGLLSFIIVFAASYAAFLISPWLPETPEVIYGIKGALNVYGSLHNVLFGLCAAGVISCLVRRYKSSS